MLTNSNFPIPGQPSTLSLMKSTFPHIKLQNITTNRNLLPHHLDVEGEPEYNVEEIQDSKKYQGKIKYLVHWEGYPTEEDTWEPAENVKHAQELITKFHADYPEKPAPPAMRL